MMIGTPSTPKIPPELQRNREAFYAELPEFNMKPLWAILRDAMTPEPTTQAVPYLWKWKDVRPRMDKAAELVSAEEAERRVLMLLNPGMEKPGATSTLFAGVQMILPHEIARTHHHTPNAIRFVIEGSRAYTTVNGERSLMEKGDFLTTPIWAWHDHGNDADVPMLWLDGLDMPFVQSVDAMFFENYPELTQPLRREVGDSISRGERFDWEESDTFVVPAWSWHEHARAGGDAVLYSFNDRPILKPFGLEREQVHPKGRQE